MVAHSLTGEVFGPAQRVHGATFVVDAGLRGEDLDAHGVLVDIALLARALQDVLDPLRHRNLDDVPDLVGRNTTTEVLAGWVADRLVAQLLGGILRPAREQVSAVVVTLHESHVAWGSCERAVPREDG
jgi:6-pyruvoyl-tetrahydropterin synthase